jgi:hypothetical protein
MSNRRKLRGKDWAPLSRRVGAVIDGRGTQLRAEIEAARPGFLDQLAAATADGARASAELAAEIEAAGRGTGIDPRQVPRQILDQVHGLYMRVISELQAGERKHCGHISLDAPVPAIACVHADWIYCRRCYPRKVTRPQLSEREEYTCDLCGTYRHGQTMDGIYPQMGPVMLLIGICPACSERIRGGQP